MHAASVILLCWAMTGAACFCSSAAPVVMGVVLTALVAVVGLPHGAADHRVARPRLEPVLGSVWLPVFLVVYLAVAVVVVSGWFLAPTATVIVFFLASAWHFGHEEPRLSIGPQALRPVFRFARGGLVMWTPLVFRTKDVSEILTVVAPADAALEITRSVGGLAAGSWGMLAIAAVAWVLQGLAAIRHRGRRRWVLLVDNALVASLVVLFVLAGPMVGFLAYFCGWHSVRGIRRLRREYGETWAQLAWSLTPLTAAAVGMIGLAAWFVLRGTGWSETLIRATFIGLSGVAMPHLLLHGIVQRVEGFGGRRPQTLRVGNPA